ncbi:MAG: DUF4159 domain-containing protein, partial [Nitrospinaceae bacterium]|nr:DUF4159 domain-containing protein [Nitrospinaceae bacterium]NIS85091.1 DUF4159 domain-containing protein [Nitrospinaceae bacterium]NIT81908.1 DUF4159 domain-containing protein [Nitrospinaceae bacterium]NIU96289.1 DUF4159 domain-containing protein [Nitrospinaceae bacterium]
MHFLFKTFLFLLFLSLGGGPEPVQAADYSKMTLPILKYRGGNFNPRPQGVRSLLAEIARRTSIEVNREPVVLELTHPDLYQYPFLYMAGDAAFDPFSEEERKILRHYLSFGGFLLIDDNSSRPDSPFDASVRKMMEALFPKIPL